jgi:hypothetical protein
MNNLIEIKYFEALAGSTIKNTLVDAMIIARRDNCAVKFDFNSIKMEVSKYDTLDDRINYYYKNLKNA